MFLQATSFDFLWNEPLFCLLTCRAFEQVIFAQQKISLLDVLFGG